MLFFANPKNLIYNHSLYANESSNSPSVNAVILASQEGMKVATQPKIYQCSMQTAKHNIAVCSQLSLISSYCYTETIVEEIEVVGEGNET